jgi:hypothetical protein
MATYKEILPSSVKTARSSLNQLIDVLQEDVSASVSRRKYQHFVTGTIASPGVTSSLFQTVYDVDFTLQTANPIMDVTFGLYPAGSIVETSQIGVDSVGKELFPSSSLMMREKIDIYRQFSQTLLGDNSLPFTAPIDSTRTSDLIDAGVFLCFKRLFARDSIKRETFAMRVFTSASNAEPVNSAPNIYAASGLGGSMIITDIGASSNKISAFGGQVGNLVDSANTANTMGLIFYDRGICVLDLAKISSASQYMSGSIAAVTPTSALVLGSAGTETAGTSKFIPDFVVSASLDNIIDHVCVVRMGSGSNTAITFQNVTNINSTLVFCNASADEFNYSSNPTYTDSDSRIVVIEESAEDTQTAFSFVTKVGLYDAADTLLAVASLSRPVAKSNERDLTIRLRLDFAMKKRISLH